VIEVSKARESKENPIQYYLHQWNADDWKNTANTKGFLKKMHLIDV